VNYEVWACRKNIETWRRLLDGETDPQRRQLLSDLIAVEEGRLLQADVDRTPASPHAAPTVRARGRNRE
jgi:hypothetical protein